MRFQPAPGGPFTTAEIRALEGVEACVHCGLCLPVCPTYEELRTSMDSPRGRLLLMRAAAEGSVPLSDRFALHMERCLVCRACETVCPSGVQFGRAMEGARAALNRERGPRPGAGESRLPGLLLKKVLLRPKRLRILARAIRAADLLGLRALARRTGVLRGIRIGGASLDALESLLPEAPPDLAPLPRRTPGQPPQRGRAGLFTGCVMDALFRKAHRDTIRCLSANGREVIVPEGQACCAALHAHAGDAETARALARRNVEAFEGGDPVVVNAAGCGAMLKEYGRLLADDPAFAERAAAFSARVADVSELLAAAGPRPPAGPFPERVTYQDACHLAHGQGVREPPRTLL
ncbi:MAG: (Fe-S)-binding protein, partial [Nitrospinota bacterium]